MYKQIPSITLLLLFLIPSSKLALGQTNSLSFELLGNGFFYSLNYERTFQEKEKRSFAYRIGAAGLPFDDFTTAVFFIPIGLEARLGKKPHQLVLGFGTSFIFTNQRNFSLHAVPSIAYRYQGKGKRIFYKFGYTPLLPNLFDTEYPYLWGAFAVGWDL